MKMPTMVSFTSTMTELKLADSLMPMTRMVVIARMANMATRLKTPVACGNADATTGIPVKLSTEGSEARAIHWF